MEVVPIKVKDSMEVVPIKFHIPEFVKEKDSSSIFVNRKKKFTLKRCNETIIDFSIRVKTVCSLCNFKPPFDEPLRDIFILEVGLPELDKELRSKYIEGNITFEETVRLAIALSSLENETQTEVNKIIKNKPTQVSKNNYFRNNNYTNVNRFSNNKHFSNNYIPNNNYRPSIKPNSIQKKVICFRCGKANHIAKDCRTHAIQMILPRTPRLSFSNKETIDAKINGLQLAMEFDTGAACSVIDEVTWNRIGRPQLSPAYKLVGYNHIQIEVLGEIKLQKAVIRIEPNTLPIALPARRVPFSLRRTIEAELDRLLDEGVIEKVDPTITPITWATPTVNILKKSGSVRICEDFRLTINKYLAIDNDLLPTFVDLTNKIAGGKIFSTIDLRDAFLQFGGIPMVSVFLDDINIAGENNSDHIVNLEEVLRKDTIIPYSADIPVVISCDASEDGLGACTPISYWPGETDCLRIEDTFGG
ncbi:uncharacterized protein LOC135922259 [Gordionus sp. m RMFG-2023]|uniref:uncharacterized protein LOC135922259 n=1 Tax=Gordionus sp. m RMFG-2023 TaxID=3053472 RepID=UPI0031FE14C3